MGKKMSITDVPITSKKVQKNFLFRLKNYKLFNIINLLNKFVKDGTETS